MSLIFVAIAAAVGTFLGGLFAFRYRDNLHLVLGFSAGALLAVAFFDLLPESIGLASGQYSVSTVTSLIAAGFFFFMIIDRFVLLHHHHDDDHEHSGKTTLGAGSLAIHSFFDGLAIGLAFQVSTAVGIVVACAVIAHDFSDGINTVGLVLRGGGSKKKAFTWLTVDAIAPVVGILASSLFAPSMGILGLFLAVFCGFFLYIGASDLLPESHHRHPTYFTTLMTLLGAAVLFVVITIAG